MLVSNADSRSVTRSEDLLLAFYTGNGRDVQGRTHAEILAWSDALLEAVHDYIQWLFPLPEASGFNPLAPLLTPALIEEFRNSEALRSRLRASCSHARLLRVHPQPSRSCYAFRLIPFAGGQLARSA